MGYKRSRTKKVKGVRMRKLCRLSLSTRGFICLYLLPAVAVSLASPTIHTCGSCVSCFVVRFYMRLYLFLVDYLLGR